MNTNQIARLKSFELVVVEARKKPLTVAMIPKFASGIERLDVINREIRRNWIEQDRNMSGLAADKLQKHKALSDMTLEISGAVHSYAVEINDLTLMGKVYYTTTVVSDMTQKELLTAAETVNIEAKKIPPATLANEGIAVEELTAFGDLIEAYSEAEPTPREATIDRSAYTEAIRLLFKEATLLFKNTLNRLAVQFKRKDPDFYLKYRAARNVIYITPPDTDTPPAS